MSFSPISVGLEANEVIYPNPLDWTIKSKDTTLHALKRATQEMICTFREKFDEHSSILAIARMAVAGRRVLLPPQNQEDALKRIALLSGRRHRIYTSLLLSHRDQLHSSLSMTHVSFKLLTRQEKDTYVREDLWKVDKPGAYDPMGYEARWIKSINGSHSNFIQVPSYELMNLLKGSGFLENSE